MLAPVSIPISSKLVRLTQDFEVFTSFGRFLVPVDFEWDGASIPFGLHSFSRELLGPSCVHDFLYRTGLVTKEVADAVYAELMGMNGCCPVRIALHHNTLKAFGWRAWNKHRRSTTPDNQVNKTKHMNKSEQQFVKFIDAQGFKYFSGQELLTSTRRTRDGVTNTIPPKSKWGNIVDALCIADALRGRLGVPLTIASSYRSVAYNKKCGGVKFSQHLEFKALDLQCKRRRPKTVADELYKMRRAGQFKGGIGRYKTFTHIDTRGKNASWGKN